MSATDSGDLLGGESSLGSISTSTFLFTDIEGSTRLWEEHPETMKAALEDHDRLLREVFRTHRGRVFASAGDSLAVVFQAPLAALEAAVASQRALSAETWGELGGIRVRIGIHTGAAQERDGNYFGLTLSRSARLMSIAHGGQIVISAVSASETARSDSPRCAPSG